MKKLKRLALVVLMALLASFCLFGATACDNILDRGDRDGNVVCPYDKHEWEQLVVEPDDYICGEEVPVTLRCVDCGKTKQEGVMVVDHAWVSYKKVEATCDTDGMTAYTQCARCNQFQGKEPEVLKAKGHDGENGEPRKSNSVVATCQNAAFCGVCNKVYAPKLDHEADIRQVEAQAPDCTNVGWEAYEYCALCTYTTKVEIPALDHDWNKVDAVEATCTEEGHSAYKVCLREGCGVESGKTTYEALGHDVEFKHEASLVANCQVQAFCGVCNEFYGEVDKSHEPQILRYEGKEATCTVDGYETYEDCLVEGCTYNTLVVIPATGHDYELQNENSRAATCTEAAYCGKCNQLFGEALGHDGYRPEDEGKMQHENSRPADCETQAYCGICERSYGLPLGHLNVKVEAKAPTCFEEGWKTYVVCKRLDCDYTTKVIIPRLEHNWEEIPAVAPTCTEIGYTEGRVCTLCGDKVLPREIPALGHLEGTPVCAEALICGREDCGFVLKEAGVHLNVVPVLGYAPTCLDTGLTDGTKCDVCGEAVVEQEVIGTIAHDSKGILNPVEATATTPGATQGRYCSMCRGVITVEPEEVAAHEHTFENGTCTFENCEKAEDGHMHIYQEGECVCGKAESVEDEAGEEENE